jgi:hypothetical protein
VHHVDLERDQTDRVAVGRAVAIAWWPTTPEPPVRFTTLTGCLNSFSICEAIMRAIASVPPPAAHGTISVIGCSGNAARAGGAEQAGGNQRNAARSFDVAKHFRIPPVCFFMRDVAASALFAIPDAASL